MKDRPSRVPDLAALALGAGLTGSATLPRLPQSLDMIVPRHAGLWLFEAAIDHRGSLGALSLALLWLAALAFAHLAWKHGRAWWAAARGRGAAWSVLGLAFLAWAGRFAVSSGLDVIQNGWFMPESLDPRELALSAALVLAAALLFTRAAAGLLKWTAQPSRKAAPPAIVPAALLLALGAGCDLWAVARLDAGQRSLTAAAALPPAARRTRVFVVLTEKEGKPDYEIHPLDLGVPGKSEFSPESLKAAARYATSRKSVFALAALRYLYGGYTMEMDAGNLRGALTAGHLLGDPAARVLLLENLAWAPPGKDAAALLSLLSDEAAYRVGSLAAAQLAVAYDHLGAPEKAAYWRGRSGIPEGLLARRDGGGALKPGAIRGKIKGARRPVRVGLYAHPDPMAPYALGPGQLVDAATADATGAFAFKGLAAGDYFLAFTLDFDEGRAPETIRCRGHRGDIRLSKARPKADLPALELQF